MYAIGSVASCDAQGFFTQLGAIGTPLYNVSLATFYYLMLKRNWSIRRLKKVEIWFHLVPWVVGLSTAAWGLIAKLYAGTLNGCW